MGLIVVPIVEGKVEEWKDWSSSFSGERKSEFDDLNKRYGLTRHDVWYAETPTGPVAIVLHEGPGADSFMENVARSDNGFDVWMREHIEKFHNMKLDAPPPGPLPVKMN